MTRGTFPPDLPLPLLLLLLSRAPAKRISSPPPLLPFPLPSSQSRRVVSAICMYLRCQFPKTVICRALNRFGLLFAARLIVTRDPGRFRTERNNHRRGLLASDTTERYLSVASIQRADEIFRERKKNRKNINQIYVYIRGI